jgi:hypothetical protein
MRKYTSDTQLFVQPYTPSISQTHIVLRQSCRCIQEHVRRTVSAKNSHFGSQAVPIDPAKLPRIDTVDERFALHTIEMAESLVAISGSCTAAVTQRQLRYGFASRRCASESNRTFVVTRQSLAACKALKVLKSTVLKRLASVVQLFPA